MSVVEVNRTTETQLGRGSTQTEVHDAGSQSQSEGAQVVTRAVATPEIALTSAVASPEIAAVKRSAVHVGIEFSFTLAWQGKKGGAG